LGKFWSHLWDPIDTELKKSTNFHPHTDGQTKVVNMKVVHLLQGYRSKHPKLWDEQLPYVQHAYNHVMNSSNQKTPFESCLGYLPKSPMEFVFGEVKNMDRMI